MSGTVQSAECDGVACRHAAARREAARDRADDVAASLEDDFVASRFHGCGLGDAAVDMACPCHTIDGQRVLCHRIAEN